MTGLRFAAGEMAARLLYALAATVLASGLACALSTGALAATFTVKNTNNGGDGSLRQAILLANGRMGEDEIRFRIGGNGVKTIRPRTPLPAITTDPLRIDGYTQQGARRNTLQRGTNARIRIQIDGSLAGDAASGLVIGAGADGSRISGLAVNRFALEGVLLDGADGVTLDGNFIGTGASGAAALGNGRPGVEIRGGANHTIGGTEPAARNLISGNDFAGVRLLNAGSSGNTVAGNLIGTNASGGGALGNVGPGVQVILDANDNTIGGAVAGARNVISGNRDEGIVVSGSENRILGNFVGTDASGTSSLGNAEDGILVSGGSNTVGGSLGGSRNVVSGNASGGVTIAGDGNSVLGNRIGTDVTGGAGLPNGGAGVELSGQGNTIGGPSDAEGNLISRNDSNGILIASGGAENRVLGNLIGTDGTGDARLGNRSAGVLVFGDRNDIGGTASGAGNVVSGNGTGIAVLSLPDRSSTAAGNRILGNLVGTDASGEDDLGNAFNGLVIEDAEDTVVGGTALRARNVISGNGTNGVRIRRTTSTQVLANLIGTDASGSAGLGNDANGVLIEAGASDNSVGGTQSGAGNTIASNGADGVSVQDTASGNSILGNSTFSNGTLATHLGIDLGADGVTANDADDADAGANGLQNYPEIGSATKSGSTVTVGGTLNSTPSRAFTVQCFLATGTQQDAGHGEGSRLLGETTVTTDGDGDADFTCSGTVGTSPAQQRVTATATDNLTGDTSEFSANRTVR